MEVGAAQRLIRESQTDNPLEVAQNTAASGEIFNSARNQHNNSNNTTNNTTNINHNYYFSLIVNSDDVSFESVGVTIVFLLLVVVVLIKYVGILQLNAFLHTD